MSNVFEYVNIPSIRFSILENLKEYLSNHPKTSDKKIFLGDAWRLGKFPCICIIWADDTELSIYRPKGVTEIAIEGWVYTNSPDSEEPYRLQRPLMEDIYGAIYDYIVSNTLGEAINANVFIDITAEESDRLVMRPNFGSRINMIVKWNKIGRSG